MSNQAIEAASIFLDSLRYYERLNDHSLGEIEQSVIEEAAQLVPTNSDDDEYVPSLKGLIILLIERFRRTSETRDLDHAILRAQDMVAASPRGHPDREARVKDWISLMLAKTAFEGFKDDDLEEVVRLARQAGVILQVENRASTARSSPPRQASLHMYLKLNHRRLESNFKLEQAEFANADLVVAEGIATTPAECASIMELLHDEGLISVLTGLQLFERFKTTESMDDLNKSIKLFEKAVDHIAETDPGPDAQSSRLTILGGLYGERFEHTGSELDLENSITLTRRALDIMAESSLDTDGLSQLAASFSGLEIRLSDRYKRFGYLEDLREAIDAAEMAVNLTPRDEEEFLGRINNLGMRLSERFDRDGNRKDLDQAIDYIEEAASTDTSQNAESRLIYSNNLGIHLSTRFKLTGQTVDLDRAFKVLEEAVIMSVPKHSMWCKSLHNFASVLAERFEQFGQVPDLDRAIEMQTKAIEATPDGHPDRVDRINNLGLWLYKRACCNGSRDDIDHSIELIQGALASLPQGHPNRLRLLTALGSSFDMRSERFGFTHDYRYGIEALKEAASLATPGHCMRAVILNNLGSTLSSQAQKLARRQKSTGTPDSEIDDTFVEAIAILRESINATSEGDTDRPSRLANLGNCLGRRFIHNGSVDADTIRDAIKAMDSAIRATHRSNPARAMYLSGLGDLFSFRHRQTGAAKDLTDALECYKDGWRVQSAAHHVRIRLARDAAEILAQQSSWEEAASLQQTDKEDMLAKFRGLASLAAAAALNAGKSPYDALRLLELGRGVISSSFFDMRGEVSDLMAKHPSLAAKFTSLRDELDSTGALWASTTPSEDLSSWELQSRTRYETARRFNEVLSEINAQEGFRHFCGVPDEKEFQQTAISGPIVVVNATSYRCDAFLIQCDGIRALRLPNLNMEEIETYFRGPATTPDGEIIDLEAMMEWLWTSIASPCLEALDFTLPICEEDHAEWPHIWWILTGLISEFPIHAAGKHRHNKGETVLDRVMSSYATSIRAIIHGRRNGASTEVAETSSDTALLLAMPTTPGLHRDGILQWAQREIDVVASLCSSLGLQIVTPESRKDEVLEGIQSCKIFHFAGHGGAHRFEPSQSCLLLKDWKTNALTAADIRDCRVQEKRPFLAYLSACHTGQTVAPRLKDEGIHLISSLQLAGFRHVVGTLWQVSDPHCVDIARVFYNNLEKQGMTDQSICRGLHLATRLLRRSAMTSLRDDYVGEGVPERKAYCLEDETVGRLFTNYHWIPYVHYGI